MDDDNFDKSDSTEEVDEKSDTETECFDKGDSDCLSQSEKSKELRCVQCKINFEILDEFENHKKHRHPLIIYKCNIDTCLRWFTSRKGRDKHSENQKSRLHKTGEVKPPPSHAIFIENASAEQIEIVKSYTNSANRPKGKRGPKPKILTQEVEKNFLIGLPRDQLKRKLMDSVVEKIEASPTKNPSQNADNSPASLLQSPLSSSIKRRTSSGQTKPFPVKVIDSESLKESSEGPSTVDCPRQKPLPNMSQMKVPVLPLDGEAPISLARFSEDLLALLSNYDVAGFFQHPLIEQFAPGASQLADQIDMRTIEARLRRGAYGQEGIGPLRDDLLRLYSNGIRSFPERSAGWREATRLFQTAVVNLERAEGRLQCHGGPVVKEGGPVAREGELRVLPPLTRVALPGEDRGGAVAKDDRRGRVSVLCYLDYGPNFSFGPSYDSGGAHCSKETSDLLLRGYGDGGDHDEAWERDLEAIIPEPGLGDDFSLYLMNVLTRDVLRAADNGEEQIAKAENSNFDLEIPLEMVNSKEGSLSQLQRRLDDSGDDLRLLKELNYQRLACRLTSPTAEEVMMADRVTSNLTALISEVTPDEVVDRPSIRKVLDLVL